MAIGTDGQVRRSCSGRLRIPGRSEPNYGELTRSLREQFGGAAVVAMQPFGMGRFELLFAEQRLLDGAVQKGFLFENAKLEVEPVESPLKWVYVKYAPFELDKKDFDTYLAPFGEIVSIEFVYPREIHPLHSGERKLKFNMKTPLPNYLKIGTYQVEISYSGVVKLCRKCHGRDHVARDCKNNICRKCGEPGHVEAGCREESGSSVENSPGDVLRIIGNTRDELLRDLRAVNPTRTLTVRNEDREEQEREPEQKDDTETDDTQDHEEQPESMPELEETEESEKDEDTGMDTEEESTGDEQDLERNKYLKDKGENKKDDSREIESNGGKKKKMSKQERKKKRLIEEKERNKKREREESKSPGTEESVTQEGSKGETKKLEKRKEEKEYMIVHFDLPDMTYGELKERTSRKFQVGVIRSIKKTEQGMWAIEFNDDRWAKQVIRKGLIDDDMTFYPVLTTLGNRSREIQYSPEKVMSMAEEKDFKI